MKIKRYEVSVFWLKSLFSGNRYDFQVTENPIPEDAQLIRIAVDERQSSPTKISLYFYSESFPDVPEGEALPATDMYARIHYNDIYSDKFDMCPG